MLAEGLAVVAHAIIFILEKLESDHRLSEQQREAARVALSNAFNATVGYYGKLATGEAKSVEREHEIAALWDEAAVRIEPIDNVLANRLGLKSRFWREGAAWTDEQIKDANIQLDKVRRDVRAATLRKP